MVGDELQRGGGGLFLAVDGPPGCRGRSATAVQRIGRELAAPGESTRACRRRTRVVEAGGCRGGAPACPRVRKRRDGRRGSPYCPVTRRRDLLPRRGRRDRASTAASSWGCAPPASTAARSARPARRGAIVACTSRSPRRPSARASAPASAAGPSWRRRRPGDSVPRLVSGRSVHRAGFLSGLRGRSAASLGVGARHLRRTVAAGWGDPGRAGPVPAAGARQALPPRQLPMAGGPCSGSRACALQCPLPRRFGRPPGPAADARNGAPPGRWSCGSTTASWTGGCAQFRPVGPRGVESVLCGFRRAVRPASAGLGVSGPPTRPTGAPRRVSLSLVRFLLPFVARLQACSTSTRAPRSSAPPRGDRLAKEVRRRPACASRAPSTASRRRARGRRAGQRRRGDHGQRPARGGAGRAGSAVSRADALLPARGAVAAARTGSPPWDPGARTPRGPRRRSRPASSLEQHADGRGKRLRAIHRVRSPHWWRRARRPGFSGGTCVRRALAVWTRRPGAPSAGDRRAAVMHLGVPTSSVETTRFPATRGAFSGGLQRRRQKRRYRTVAT
jgi:hypothetical protein